MVRDWLVSGQKRGDFLAAVSLHLSFSPPLSSLVQHESNQHTHGKITGASTWQFLLYIGGPGRRNLYRTNHARGATPRRTRTSKNTHHCTSPCRRVDDGLPGDSCDRNSPDPWRRESTDPAERREEHVRCWDGIKLTKLAWHSTRSIDSLVGLEIESLLVFLKNLSWGVAVFHSMGAVDFPLETLGWYIPEKFLTGGLVSVSSVTSNTVDSTLNTNSQCDEH